MGAARGVTVRLRRLGARARAVVSKGTEIVVGRPKLGACDVVGRWSRVRSGRAIIANAGRIEIGSRTRLTCNYGPIELRTAPGARLTIGSRTGINFTTLIDAAERIDIGDRVDIGPYCVIADAVLGEGGEVVETSPITIEDGAWLASRVTVLPGTRIGAGAVITAGSIVSGTVPPRVVAGGIPARVLRRLDGGEDASDVAEMADVADRAARSSPAPAAWSAPVAVAQAPEPSGAALLISDFTIDPLVPALALTNPAFRAELAPFGAVVASVMAPPTEARDLAVVWTRPELTLSTLRAALDADAVTADAIASEVDRYAAQIATGLGEFRCVVVPTWTVPPWVRGRGLLDHRPGGVAWALGIANQRLAGALADAPNVFVVDAQRWIATVGERAYNERLHYLGKIPFDDAVFATAAEEIAAAFAAVQGAARKLIVVDLDNTLWGGVVGDIGWEELRLGGHDAVGEAFADFQRALKALQRRGIVLAVVSKNEELVAFEAIDRHGAMVLRRDDFVAHRINWADKAQNIVEIAAELNLGLQSVVFLDDNDHERARVREVLPEVLVPEWPDDPTQFVKALGSLRCFDTAAVTAEDLDRTTMYAAEQQRASMRADVGSLDDWIRDLGIVVTADPLSPANLPRASQLLNKTNQMNLRTRRMTAAEMAEWPSEGRRQTWCVSVADRLGDAGLTGIVSVDVGGDIAQLADFVLSCRVMGRRVEETMIHVAATMAAELGATTLIAELVPTAKNMPCRRFFESGVMAKVGDERFELELDVAPPAPDGITIELPSTYRAGRS